MLYHSQESTGRLVRLKRELGHAPDRGVGRMMAFATPRCLLPVRMRRMGPIAELIGLHAVLSVGRGPSQSIARPRKAVRGVAAARNVAGPEQSLPTE